MTSAAQMAEEIAPLSVYDASVCEFLSGLDALRGLLTRAEEFVALGRMVEHDLVEFRLAPDMDPFRSQIQRASDTAKGGVMGLAGRKVPRFEDTEATLGELRQRIDVTVELLQSISPIELAGSEARIIKINLRRRWITFDGRSYLLEFALPNFFFHVTIAYAILRHKGLNIGKLDYLVRVGERRSTLKDGIGV
ncbi:hypothetical protein J2Z31_005372 [Sinorhizobium kostiense]|uniref:DUF1993 domain-containing protein n=1 Tax=Sinorhizobium kostiense TaxID=76747 RepID=A0ABS4R7G3_9HYPH|nr:DUF1993 domain-containing protein [Sinorhizobium kostiense]MBP2238831.1 hypothetical protein [Sinorhizobium kostiense]